MKAKKSEPMLTETTTDFLIRKLNAEDVDTLKAVIDSTGLFPSQMLDGMLVDYLTNTASTDIWLTATLERQPIAIAYCAPERLTSGTYNLYLIAVQKSKQGTGVGSRMMGYVEQILRSAGERILLVETSGLPEFEDTRRFYDGCGYTREAIVRDFYREGEDKVIFWKNLSR